ncbi:hypothetical protein Afil01_13630 [Actinorhabdospora filicis]|uniref:non-specific serine/threonine protein kinase n=1 Tax=Actinorhabdospora filicis TaxID=1785913 RepID=A0A9W6SL14_9ACTN|nr:serine/threonine-protein kinase [Actinorhabdospora filicis]GLZ76556.1 hypothetical protein Afil01_13630 [Actinorhabdospora filicis]
MTTQTPVPDDGRAAAGAMLAGRYELRAAIGEGGMGGVWRAHDTLLQRDVAVKEVLLPIELPGPERQTLIERTMREARAAAALSHASVIRVFDVITEAGRPWIIMELLQARSLADIIKADGPMPPRVVAKIGLSMLGALEAAHAAGILHRDVKPGNVLISADGRCVLSDFGVARTNQPSNLTTPGMVLGSAHYIAPERATGGQIGPASDLFSLGVTLYAAVEGRPPFDRPSALATMQAVVQDPPESPRRAGALTPILGGLLDKDPQHRWNVPQTRAALQQLLSGRGALASQDIDGLTDLHRVIPQQQQRPVSGPPTGAFPPAPVSAAPVSGPHAAGVLESTAAHPAPSPFDSGSYEQTRPFSPPPQPGAYPPPQPSYGPPQQQPFGAPPQGPPFPPQQPPFGQPQPDGGKPSGIGGLIATAKRHTKPWMLAVGAAVVVIALVFAGIGIFGGGKDDPNNANPAGNNTSDKPAGPSSTYDDPEGKYSVKVPKGWTVKVNGKGKVDVIDPQDKDTWIRFNVVSKEGEPATVLENAVKGLDGSQFAKDSVKTVASGPITVAGKEGAMIEYTGTRKDDDQPRHAIWAIIQVDDVSYHIYLSVPEEKWAASKPVFDAAVKSYALT